MAAKTYVGTFKKNGNATYMAFAGDNKELAVDHARHVAMCEKIEYVGCKCVPGIANEKLGEFVNDPNTLF